MIWGYVFEDTQKMRDHLQFYLEFYNFNREVKNIEVILKRIYNIGML